MGLLLPDATSSYIQAEEATRFCELAFKEHPEFLRNSANRNSFLELSNPKYRQATYVFFLNTDVRW